jgi:DNA-binding protein Alba
LSEPKTVYVGRKPAKAYVAFAQLFLKTADEVVLTARGKWISKAVDVAEILKRQKLQIKEMVSNTTSMKNREEQDQFVSVIQITIKKS